MVRLVMKWVRAGVMEDGKLSDVEAGTPQGGVISPRWPTSTSLRIRSLGPEVAEDGGARRGVRRALRRRRRDGLRGRRGRAGDADGSGRTPCPVRFALHPDKTRVLEFGRYACERRERRGLPKPETFDFLGFTHIAGTSRRGTFQLQRHTSRRRRRAKLASLKQEIDRRRHAPVAEQHRWLCFGAARPLPVLRRSHELPSVEQLLARARLDLASQPQLRSQRGRWSYVHWGTSERRSLPEPQILHPWPTERFARRTTRGGSPVREIRSPGSVPGGPMRPSLPERCAGENRRERAGERDTTTPTVEQVLPREEPTPGSPPLRVGGDPRGEA